MLIKTKDIFFNSSEKFDVKEYKSFRETFLKEKKYRKKVYFLNIIAFILFGLVSFNLFPYSIAIRNLIFFPIIILFASFTSNLNEISDLKEPPQKKFVSYFLCLLLSTVFIIVYSFFTNAYIKNFEMETNPYTLGLIVSLILIMIVSLFFTALIYKEKIKDNIFFSEKIKKILLYIYKKEFLTGTFTAIFIIISIPVVANHFIVVIELLVDFSSFTLTFFMGTSSSFFLGIEENLLLLFVFCSFEIILLIIDEILSPFLYRISSTINFNNIEKISSKEKK